MIKLNLACMLGILLMGCLTGCLGSFSPEFVIVVNDHRQLTTETNTALMESIREELSEIDDLDKREALEGLLERLEIISGQSEVIDKFVKEKLTSEQLAIFLRTKWRVR